MFVQKCKICGWKLNFRKFRH